LRVAVWPEASSARKSIAAAERKLAGTGWLPQPLRMPEAPAVGDTPAPEDADEEEVFAEAA
jgi:hypothetical protein